MYTFISFLVLIMLSSSDSKHFTRCGLVVELLKQGFPSDLLRDWVCLIEAESSRRTEVVGGPEHDGSMEYGLFQIDDKYWCTKGKPGNGCNVRCEDLLADDITKSCKCALKIFSLQGFRAWYGWLNKCYNKQLPDISNCT